MPTNDERREVARNLGGYDPVRFSLRSVSKENLVNYCLLWKALEESFPKINEHVHDITDKLYNLAKLIEPEPERTCHVESWHYENENVMPFISYELSCGHENDGFSIPCYCPICGAKVVDDGD